MSSKNFKTGDQVRIKELTTFDQRVGLQIGDVAVVVNSTPSITEVKFEEWRDPAAPMFHDGQRVMVSVCLELIKPLGG